MHKEVAILLDYSLTSTKLEFLKLHATLLSSVGSPTKMQDTGKEVWGFL